MHQMDKSQKVLSSDKQRRPCTEQYGLYQIWKPAKQYLSLFRAVDTRSRGIKSCIGMQNTKWSFLTSKERRGIHSGKSYSCLKPSTLSIVFYTVKTKNLMHTSREEEFIKLAEAYGFVRHKVLKVWRGPELGRDVTVGRNTERPVPQECVCHSHRLSGRWPSARGRRPMCTGAEPCASTVCPGRAVLIALEPHGGQPLT